jgi:hypothetical protein
MVAREYDPVLAYIGTALSWHMLGKQGNVNSGWIWGDIHRFLKQLFFIEENVSHKKCPCCNLQLKIAGFFSFTVLENNCREKTKQHGM